MAWHSEVFPLLGYGQSLDMAPSSTIYPVAFTVHHYGIQLNDRSLRRGLRRHAKSFKAGSFVHVLAARALELLTPIDRRGPTAHDDDLTTDP